jgi:L-ascorbate metabolism protein UlaG (beta-lactamase superfamily)
VAHGDIIANVDAILLLHAVQDAVVLNVGIVANANLMNVAAEDGVHPNAGMLANNDVANELSRVVDIGGSGELGSDTFVGADHGIVQRRDSLTRRKDNTGVRSEVVGARNS